MEKIYLVQTAYSGMDTNGINHQVHYAKNRTEAVKKALDNLKGYKCCFLSVKRVPKKFAELAAVHNENLRRCQ